MTTQSYMVKEKVTDLNETSTKMNQFNVSESKRMDDWVKKNK